MNDRKSIVSSLNISYILLNSLPHITKIFCSSLPAPGNVTSTTPSTYLAKSSIAAHLKQMDLKKGSKTESSTSEQKKKKIEQTEDKNDDQ